MLPVRLQCQTKRHGKSDDAFKMNKIELFELKQGALNKRSKE
jgi:hypothetical protein